VAPCRHRRRSGGAGDGASDRRCARARRRCVVAPRRVGDGGQRDRRASVGRRPRGLSHGRRRRRHRRLRANVRA
jgi:hypothetical protein